MSMRAETDNLKMAGAAATLIISESKHQLGDMTGATKQFYALKIAGSWNARKIVAFKPDIV